MFVILINGYQLHFLVLHLKGRVRVLILHGGIECPKHNVRKIPMLVSHKFEYYVVVILSILEKLRF